MPVLITFFLFAISSLASADFAIPHNQVIYKVRHQFIPPPLRIILIIVPPIPFLKKGTEDQFDLIQSFYRDSSEVGCLLPT